MHFETVITKSDMSYSFGRDWRASSDFGIAPLLEGLMAEVRCEVTGPAKYAGKAVLVHLLTAPDTEEAEGVGHYAVSKREATVWLPSNAVWWSVMHSIGLKQICRLSFTVREPLRGTPKIAQVYFSGDDEVAEGVRLGKLIESRMGHSEAGFDEAELRRRLEALHTPRRRREPDAET